LAAAPRAKFTDWQAMAGTLSPDIRTWSEISMRKGLLVTAVLFALAGSGCTVAEERAGGGAALGAGAGAIIGGLATGRAGGALAGAALGGATGAIVGAATTPAYPLPPRPVVVERIRERPVYVEEVDVAPVCRTRIERVYDPYGGVEVRRIRTCG